MFDKLDFIVEKYREMSLKVRSRGDKRSARLAEIHQRDG